MQIVIDIPEVFYEALKKTDEILGGQRSGKTLMSVIYNAVAKGTPLPKGHGRLIDADVVDDNIYDLTRSMDLNYGQISEVVDNAPTIIEADSEKE